MNPFATSSIPLLYLHPGFGPGTIFRKKNAKGMEDTGDGTPLAACDHRDPCRLVTIGNYIHIWIDIDFVRQIACDHTDLFVDFCRFLPIIVQAILAEKVRSPHPLFSIVNIDSPARPIVPGLARSCAAIRARSNPFPHAPEHRMAFAWHSQTPSNYYYYYYYYY